MNRTSKIFSIGMPVYNGEKYIRRALDSLLTQTFADFELIISDNGSTDHTEAICLEYAEKDPRIQYTRQAKNLGAAANFKYVLDRAIGDYFMWAAHDDVWDKYWVEMLLPVAVDSQCLAFGTVQAIDGNGNHMRHPSDRRIFNYTGARFMRRLKYYLDPGFLGKPNLIYGIYPRRLIINDVFNVLKIDAEGTDMFFLYRLLVDVDIKGGAAAVFLYKRIHDDNLCTIQKTKNKNYLFAIFNSLINNCGHQLQQMYYLSKLSSEIERVAQIVLFPLFLIKYLFYLVVNKLRFRSQ